MIGKLDLFRIECGIHGAAIIANTDRLTSNCLADGEIDWHIEALKADLDACGREMKRRAKKERDALFLQRHANA